MALALPVLIPLGSAVTTAVSTATFLVVRHVQRKIKHAKMKEKGLLDDVNIIGTNTGILMCREALNIKFYIAKRCILTLVKSYYHAALLATFTYRGREYNVIVEGTEMCSKLVPFINTSPELVETTRSLCGSKMMSPYELGALSKKNPLNFKEYSIQDCNCYYWLEECAKLLGSPVQEELIYHVGELKKSIDKVSAFIGSGFSSVSP